jgi:hypothetical protein
MPNCKADGYPMVPVRETDAGMTWECTNPWHPRNPGPCPGCGDSGRVRSQAQGPDATARCARCGHEWRPSDTQAAGPPL